MSTAEQPAPSTGGAGGVLRSVGRFLRRPITPARAAVLVVGVLLLAELGMRSIEPYLPKARAGDQIEVELKWDQITELAGKGTPVDVVFFGNSAMDSGVDPAVWSATSRSYPSAYNASLLGQPFDNMNRWADEFVLSELHPQVVVYGITPFDVPTAEIKRSSRALIDASFNQAMDQLRPGPLQRMEQRLEDHSALVRKRGAFAAPSDLFRAVKDRLLGHAKPQTPPFEPVTLPNDKVVLRSPEVWKDQLMLPRGGNANYHAVTTPVPRIDFGLNAGQQRQFRESYTTEQQLRDLVDTARRHGARTVVFAIPPMFSDAYLYMTGDNATALQSIARIGREARSMGVAVFDFSQADYPHDEFADPVHLNAKGSVHFSKELAAMVDRL